MSQESTILLLGGTGKVASAIVPLLDASRHPYLLASRSGNGKNGCKVDLSDKTTYDIPFQTARSPIKAVFLVSPSVEDVVTPLKSFIDFARTNGVNRFVLMSASIVPKGGVAMGQVHEYLENLGVEWAVLRPSWFMENFSTPEMMRFDIATDKVYDAAGDGKLPFVSVKDIAAVAYHALVDEDPHNTDHIILGPELMNYQDVCDILTEVIGRPIEHVSLSIADLATRWSQTGMPEDYAMMLAGMDSLVRDGAENRTNDTVYKVTKMKPTSFRQFAQENKWRWEK